MLAKGQTDRAKDLTDQISDWDTRLALRKSTLTAKFTKGLVESTTEQIGYGAKEEVITEEEYEYKAKP